jgi:hypothetical protein
MSVWLGLVGAAVIAVWMAGCLARQRWREVGAFVAAGIVAAVLIVPFALDLKAAGHDHSTPVTLDVRRTGSIEWCYDQLGVSKTSAVRQVGNLVFLPACYFLEFGAFAIGAVAYWWIRRREGGALTDEEWFQICIVVVPMLLCSFLRSAIRNNDLGWRGVLCVQFMAHVWTTSVVGWLITTKMRGWFRRLVALALAVTATLGFLGVLYEIGATRLNVWCGEAADLRSAYAWCRTHTDTRAVFQHYPVPVFGYDVNDVFHGLHGDRQVVLADGHYGRIYGISEPMYQELEPRVLRMFEADAEWEEVRDIAFRLKINYLVVRSRAPVWDNRASWVWQRTPVYANAYVRVFAVN